MDVHTTSSRDSPDRQGWREVVDRYRRPSRIRAIWQLSNTFIPYGLLWCLMYWGKEFAWWTLPPLVALAAGLLLRIFIIFHDCGHGSFFSSPRANDWVGRIAGVLTFTPYRHWTWEHAIHHGTTGHLDKRGTGDIWTMTVREYLASSRWRRFSYRLARNPVVLFVLAPFFVFGIAQRWPSPGAGTRERHSVWGTNLALLCVAVAMSHAFGVGTYFVLQVAMLGLAGGLGIWMFYVQHQFEDVYWERDREWNYVSAALEGSSFYQLPKVLQWFSASIGFHHVHHLSVRIPNYNLQRCHESHSLLRGVKPLSLLGSLRSLRLHLWDENSRKLVSFRRRRGSAHSDDSK